MRLSTNLPARSPAPRTLVAGTPKVHTRRRANNSFIFNKKEWCPGWESNPHEEKSPEDFKCYLPLRTSPCMSTTNTDSSGFADGLLAGQCPSDFIAAGRIGKIRQSTNHALFRA